MEKEIVVNRLRLGKQYVGYRIDVVSEGQRVLSFDVADDLVKQFLELFHSDNIKKGVVIDGKVSNGFFVTSNEQCVHEVTSLEVGRYLLNRFYFFDMPISDDVLGATETSEEAAIREKEEYQRYLDTLITGYRPNLKEEMYSDEGDIKHVYGYLEKAAEGVVCDIQYDVQPDKWSGRVYLRCHFVDFREMLKFAYNLLGLLNRKTCSAYLEVEYLEEAGKPSKVLKNSRIPRRGSQSQFVSSILKSLDLDGSKRISVTDIEIVSYGGGLAGGDVDIGDEGDTFVLSYECEAPGYIKHWSGDLKRNKFFVPVGAGK